MTHPKPCPYRCKECGHDCPDCDRGRISAAISAAVSEQKEKDAKVADEFMEGEQIAAAIREGA